MHLSRKSTRYHNAMDNMWKFAITIVVGFMVVFIHSLSLFIFCKQKHFRKNNFICMVLRLSISDLLFAVGLIAHSFTNYFSNGEIYFRYQCALLKDILGGTVIFSLFQTLQICLQQLSATFVTKKKILVFMTSFNSMLIGCCVCYVLAITRFCLTNFPSPALCNAFYFLTTMFQLSVDAIGLLIVCFIFICYSCTIFRTYRYFKMTATESHVMTETQKAKREETIKRMKRNVRTVCIILLFMLVAYMPRMILFIVVNVTWSRYDPSMEVFLAYSNLLLFMNILLDPFVYILRFKSVREDLFRICRSRNTITPFSGNDITNHV